ncbi:MAG: ATP-binding protein [Phycisphaerae bacterium]
MTTRTKQIREIVHIDEDKCDGCGLCVPSCAEGAIQIIDGKAKLVADNLCDGLGNCLGTCPKDAIHIERREADEFDEEAVSEHVGHKPDDDSGDPAADVSAAPPAPKPQVFTCPGMRLRIPQKDDANARPAPPEPTKAEASGGESQLRQWPVQLSLLPAGGEMWKDADVLLATIFAQGGVKSLTIARMEVPCCGGLERIVQAAMQQAGVQIPLTVAVVSVEGKILEINGCRVA